MPKSTFVLQKDKAGQDVEGKEEDNIEKFEPSQLVIEERTEEYEKYVKRRILKSVVIVVAASGTLNFAVGEEMMEHIMDLAHSCYCSAQGHRAAVRTKFNQQGVLMLDNKGTSIMTNLLSDSFGYFLCDTIQITFYLQKGRKLHLWKERLGHHILQSFCNLTTLTLPEDHKAGNAVRAYLAFAYLFETSQIFLRLTNMVKDPHRSQQVFKVALASFFIYRVCNGLYAYVCQLKSRPAVPDHFWKGHVVGGASAYLLNFFWFIKLAQKNRKYMLARS